MNNRAKDQELTINALQARLDQAGISTAEWGKGKGKTPEQLAQEIEQGESVLVDGFICYSSISGGA